MPPNPQDEDNWAYDSDAAAEEPEGEPEETEATSEPIEDVPTEPASRKRAATEEASGSPSDKLLKKGRRGRGEGAAC